MIFNEIDPVACATLRENFNGVVYERSIKDLEPPDLAGHNRVHFFAGAGLWEYACYLAGWPATRPLWTASCPCQPFSVAGKGAGVDDPRHLWPDLFRLIRTCRPPCVVGEQVAGAAGYGWLDGVRADLEGEGYAVRAVDIPACAVDAPHQRQRLYWVAVADAAREQRGSDVDGHGPCGLGFADEDGNVELADAAPFGQRSGYGEHREHVGGGVELEGPRKGRDAFDRDAGFPMADADRGGRGGRPQDAIGNAGRRDAAERADVELEHAEGVGRGEGRTEHAVRRGWDAAADADGAGAVGDALGARLEGQRGHGDEQRGPEPHGSIAAADGSFWSDHEWLACADGKARRTKPGIRMLVNGMAGRIDLWRLAGNSIVPQLAAEVLRALL